MKEAKGLHRQKLACPSDRFGRPVPPYERMPAVIQLCTSFLAICARPGVFVSAMGGKLSFARRFSLQLGAFLRFYLKPEFKFESLHAIRNFIF